MATKNILELCLAHGLGGLEMFVAHCYEDFSQKTVCKVVVAPHTKLDNYLEDIEKFHLHRNKFFPFIPAWKLAKYIDENEIDIIHFHWTKDILTAVLAKLFSKRKPKLIQSRHMRMTRFKNDLYHRWLYKNVAILHAVTQDVAQQLNKYIPHDIMPHIVMVYLGVDFPSLKQERVEILQKEYNLQEDFVVGIIGRIEKPKGQYKVIEAVAKLSQYSVKALVVGSAMDETYLQTLQTEAERLHVSDKIIFTGFTKEVNEHMALCDVVVLATENETFGLVVIEAMVNGKVIVATAKGGPLEIIEDGVNGMLFDGSVASLTQKLALLYKNKALRETLAKNGLQTVKEKFNKKKQLDKLYEVITK
jgi:glycosyltransferase involved in cell wall biosynthesis